MAYLKTVILLILVLAVLLILFMVFFLYRKKQKHLNYKKWKAVADLLLNSAIFSSNDREFSITIPAKVSVKMKDAAFRKILAKKIITSSKSLSGDSADNLQKLYRQLNLDKDSMDKVRNSRWDIRAEGIQEVGIMKLTEHIRKVYRHTNSKHELVRTEAQVAVLRMLGFEGLRFLDVISYPISEWHQIRLLNELLHLPHEHFKGIDKWLGSGNATVVIFALKLCRRYHRFELYDNIIFCLNHKSEEVRKHAIHTLGTVYTEQTANQLMDKIGTEPLKNQILIIKTLKEVADNDAVPRLEKYLNLPNNELKIALVRTIAALVRDKDYLSGLPGADTYPLNEIIQQIKSES